MSTVDFTNLAPNSESDQDYIPGGNKEEEKEQALPSLRGKVEFKKKHWIERVFSDFRRSWPTLFWNVIVPEAGAIAFDNISALVRDSLFGGSSVPSSSRRRKGYYNDMEYSDYYDARNGGKKGQTKNTNVEKRSYDEFIFTDRLDIEDIIASLKKQAYREHKVSVADLYSIVKKQLKQAKYPPDIIELLEKPEYTDLSFGWYFEDLQDARVEILGRDRFCLDLPKAVAIK